MAELSGADVPRLEALAESFDERARSVRELERLISRECDGLERLWSGADAAEFLSAWSSRHRLKLQAAADALTDVAELLVLNAEQQERTSAADGVIAGSTPVPVAVSESGIGLGSGLRSMGAELKHRLSEFQQYSEAYIKRSASNPLQSAFDEMTLTGSFERLVGTGSILILGGEFEESTRPGEAEFITGLPFKINDAITLGHSVLIDSDAIKPNLLDHEMQHVNDVEDVGASTFYSTYLANWAVNGLHGQDMTPGGEAYENIWWEQRANATQKGSPPDDLDFGRWDPRNWFEN